MAHSAAVYGGERGIRTPGAPKGTTDFESAPFDHSGISPRSERTANFIRRARIAFGEGADPIALMHLLEGDETVENLKEIWLAAYHRLLQRQGSYFER
jgi:hypothetical protein